MRSVSPFVWLSQYYSGFFFCYGVYLPFWAVWMAWLGLSAADIGLILGLGLVTRCVANLFITPLFHRVEHLLPGLRVLSLFGLVACMSHLAAGSDFLMLSLATVFFNLLVGPSVPVSDALANYYTRIGLLDYGKTRLWGSLAFIAGSTVVGWVAGLWGPQWIPYISGLGLVYAIAMSALKPNPVPEGKPSMATVRPKVFALLRDGSVIRFLLIIALIQGSHAAYYGFSALYWKSEGYSEQSIGYLWSFGVFVEVVMFAVAGKLFRGWNPQALFRIAAVGAVVRWVVIASTSAVIPVTLAQGLHGVSFAIAHLAAMQYIQQDGESRIVALQALYSALPLGAFMALMTAVSGELYEMTGAGTFWVMAVMAATALLVKLKPQKIE
ncbi:3-phenylpropionate MFS transporter [Parasalinivibrio latis]|uniref:3-phenylpropionate MFS transporter n=1 Tax=Parasalinivibrio latis TaxID=2952610 RepID=UPI0030E4A4AC